MAGQLRDRIGWPRGRSAIVPLAEDGIDLEALYAGNLIGGMIDALSPEYRTLT